MQTATANIEPSLIDRARQMLSAGTNAYRIARALEVDLPTAKMLLAEAVKSAWKDVDERQAESRQHQRDYRETVAHSTGTKAVSMGHGRFRFDTPISLKGSSHGASDRKRNAIEQAGRSKKMQRAAA